MASGVILPPLKLPQQCVGQEFQCWAAVTVAIERFVGVDSADILTSRDPINTVCMRVTTPRGLRALCENQPRLLADTLDLRERVELRVRSISGAAVAGIELCHRAAQDVLIQELLLRRQPILAQISFVSDPTNHHVVILGGIRVVDGRVTELAVYDSMPFAQLAPKPNQNVAPTWINVCQSNSGPRLSRLVNGGYISLLNTLVGNGIKAKAEGKAWRR